MQEEASHQCEFPDCGKKFTTKFSLKRHYYIHSKQKTFNCQYCTKKFALPQYLREHQYTHTNQQPFICGVDGCTESFRQRGKLSLHRRTHENFKKKDYRLLNTEHNQKNKSKVLGKRPKEESDEPVMGCQILPTGEEAKNAQALAENWSPLKRQKTDSVPGEHVNLQEHISNQKIDSSVPEEMVDQIQNQAPVEKNDIEPIMKEEEKKVMQQQNWEEVKEEIKEENKISHQNARPNESQECQKKEEQDKDLVYPKPIKDQQQVSPASLLPQIGVQQNVIRLAATPVLQSLIAPTLATTQYAPLTIQQPLLTLNTLSSLNPLVARQQVLPLRLIEVPIQPLLVLNPLYQAQCLNVLNATNELLKATETAQQQQPKKDEAIQSSNKKNVNEIQSKEQRSKQDNVKDKNERTLTEE